MKVESRVIGLGGGPEEAFGDSIDEEELQSERFRGNGGTKWSVDL